ncbi:hypothetical protein AYO36_15895 [Exiguobacterium sp. KKBO11]|uniref:hypothetical protein n=1 Tax=Exiguobacterium sp. KKBO11 TaxID=1805000 RepID=UPI0007D7E58B|nr:hypothetical protein [Exiguobacterium sp. KKBO11]OAI82167.1 hypothetical protein AYO36_15895 [Exiguobacterium sp. KKBO11]
MKLLEIRYDDGKEEVIELRNEEDFLEFVTQLCWEKFQWTPLLEICEGIIFVHSETWEDDFFSQEGVQEWLQNNIDIENDSDEVFFLKIKKLLKIRIF